MPVDSHENKQKAHQKHRAISYFSSDEFFSFDLPNFPTLKEAISQHRTITLLFFLAGYSLVILSLITIVLLNQQIIVQMPVRAAQDLPLNTAYGSQRHVFTQTAGQAVAIYLNRENQIVAALSEDGGVNWQELSQPLVSEAVDNVSAAQDMEGKLHLVYEQKGQIIYQEIVATSQPWSVSEKVGLDISKLGHRPSLILDKDSQLPMVAWSSEYRGTILRGTQVIFMAAKADPTKLNNWCDGAKKRCGDAAVYFLKGSSDVFGGRASFSVYHVALAQMPQTGDLYLWWSDLSPGGRGNLKLAVGKKEGNGWKWGAISQEDETGNETAKQFTFSAVADVPNNRLLVSYINKAGETKVLAYSATGQKVELGNLGAIGSQFSLAAGEGGTYLFYRNPEGKVEVRRYDNSWSSPLWQSPDLGGYPSAPAMFYGVNYPFIYVTSGSVVKLRNFNPAKP